MLKFIRNISLFQAMGMLDFFTIYVFSNITGTVTINGEPAAGAEIFRYADHINDKEYIDSTTTDNNGYFEFGDISTFSLRPIVLQTVINQKIMIKYKGMEYLAWETTKLNNNKYGEINSEDASPKLPIQLECELTENQEKYQVLKIDLLNRRITGLCRIKNI